MKSQVLTEKRILNKKQHEAVTHNQGPLLVIAGAGTGKTTVITERIKYLITSGQASSVEILALTFTDKAAREMEDRVDQALPYGTAQMWISTFHSFCDRILRAEAINIGIDPGYKLMSEAETIHFFKSHLFKFELDYFRPLGNPNKFVRAILQHFNRLRDEDIMPHQYIDWVNSKFQKPKNKQKQKQTEITKTENKLSEEELSKCRELAGAYRKYEELKIKAGVADYADLISNTLKLFRIRKDVLFRYQEQFKYILIDEFQDTNFAQNELAIILAEKRKNITVVGDDDQSIYRFRGAAISNIIHFRKVFPKSKIIVLTRNYRSTAEILEKSYKLIQNNNPDRLEVVEHIDKKLECIRRINGIPIGTLLVDRVENEAENVALKIKELTDAKSEINYSWKDFAILVRANNHSQPFIQALSRNGIPYQFLGPGQLFRQAEVKDLIAYLKLLYDQSDAVALYRLLTLDFLKIGARDLSIIISYAKKTGVGLFEVCESLAHAYTPDFKSDLKLSPPLVSKDALPKITGLVDMVHRHLELMKKESAGQILYYFLSDTGLLTKLAAYKTDKEERIALNISRLFDKIKSYEATHDDASIYAVVDWIDLSMDLGESPLAADTDWTENDAVNILTIHSAKGLEFPVVFLVNLVNARFPSLDRKDTIPIPDELIKEILPTGDFHLQEERRLFYVGLTRARDMLFLTGAKYYFDAKREKKWSQFIAETIGDDFNNQIINTKKAKQLSFLEYASKAPAESSGKNIYQVSYLSHSQIESFQTCPLQYRYKNILKIPVTPKAALTFGNTIHRTLQDFYKLITSGRKLDLTELLAIYSRKWASVGYGNIAYEEKMKNQGIDILTGFYYKGFDPRIVPIDLEKIFKIKINPGLTLRGKIDRVDRLADGSLEVIDYKTGQPSKSKSPDTDLQLTIYALAAADPGMYNAEPKNIKLSFYYFDIQQKVTTTRTKADLDNATQKIADIADQIRQSTFLPTPGRHCDFCEFRLICEAWQ
ncbi:hypothetical protein A2154_00430 [Candidatus Gottesmanbacteria bacterium RBG_16_43_7]|uniref:DNA 3'-5' helicase n=1 Tax=Candidatus Gottesmanbacteria bacterium RBG_16_43_7 TaxID=1798373 RepID=A0A1F5Z9C8_9BACT|nr:MAG: hypothetical protein A2154_00430 [Candidatus Gottesmanbacteria bacterium RBG_16_43_7]